VSAPSGFTPSSRSRGVFSPSSILFVVVLHHLVEDGKTCFFVDGQNVFCRHLLTLYKIGHMQLLIKEY